MGKVAFVAALEREVSGFTQGWSRVEREHEGRNLVFFEGEGAVLLCGGVGYEAARRAASAVIALYRPTRLQSVGFAGALEAKMRVGEIFVPAVVIDARDGSRTEIAGGEGALVTFMNAASAQQKRNLAQAYGARAVDMEAAAVATAAQAHGIAFAATKVISDGLEFEMPEMDRFIDAQGQFKTASFAFYAALRPWQWGRVVSLARNSRVAARCLADHLKSFQKLLSPVVEA